LANQNSYKPFPFFNRQGLVEAEEKREEEREGDDRKVEGEKGVALLLLFCGKFT
jgi:hypothetical protein